MAKKKTKDTDEDVIENSIPKLYKDFESTIFNASSIIDSDRTTISISPAFDLGVGGLTTGSFLSLTGKQKLGKTVLALSIAARAQRLEYANPILCPKGRKVAYFNIEHRIKPRDLQGIVGLDLSEDRFKIIQSSSGNILSSEEWCTRIERFINEEPGSIIIIDSFSVLSSQAEMTSESGYQDRGKSHSIISQLCRKISSPLVINDALVIGITHLVSNTSGYGASMIEKTANSLTYLQDYKLFGKSVEPWRTGTDEKSSQCGQKVEWQVVFSGIFPPGAKLKSHIRYDWGLDCESELSEIGIQFGLISKSGNWYQLTFLGGDDASKKYNGLEQLAIVLKEKPEWYSLLHKQVYTLGGCEHLLKKE